MVTTTNKTTEEVNMASQYTGKNVLCPSCGNKARLLASKTGRFLFLCHNCGLQCFSRGELSEKWFIELIKKADIEALKANKGKNSKAEIAELKPDLASLQEERAKAASLSPTPDKDVSSSKGQKKVVQETAEEEKKKEAEKGWPLNIFFEEQE